MFECWSDIGLVRVCFDWSWAVVGVTSKKDEGAICFFYDSIYMMVPRQSAIDIHT